MGTVFRRFYQRDIGVKPIANEAFPTMRSMTNAKALGPDKLSVEPLKLGLNHNPTALQEFQPITELAPSQRTVPWRWRDAVIDILHKTKGIVERGNFCGISPVAHSGRILLKTADTKVRAYREANELRMEEQRRFYEHDVRSTQATSLGKRSARTAVLLYFIDLQNAYSSVDPTLL